MAPGKNRGTVEPVADAPAAVADIGDARAVVVADYHAGIEVAFRREGVELDDRSGTRRRRLCELVDETRADRVVVLGDLIHSIGEPGDTERAELAALFDALSVPLTLVKGNHDGSIEPFLEDIENAVVTPPTGVRLGQVGFVHGHTWPSPAVLGAAVVCMGHEHPVVRLTDEVGGTRLERVWLRGRLDPTPFVERELVSTLDGDLVVFPAFNDRTGGTWVNVEGQTYLSPFLPAGLADGEAYLLDGTRLGAYQCV